MRLTLICAALLIGFSGVGEGAVLVTHYDASNLTSVPDGTTVTQLSDISGNNNHATGNGTYLANGIGGLPSVQFTVGQGYSSVFALGSQFGIQGDAGWTQIFVGRLINTNAGSPTARPKFGGLGNGFSVGGMSGLEIENTSPTTSRFDVSGGNSTDVVLEPGDSFTQFVNRDVLITVTHQANTGKSMGNTIDIFFNGDAPGEGVLAGNTLGVTGSGGTTTLNLFNEPLTLGTSARGYVGMNGLISEVLIYDGALSDLERRQVELALGQKYGIFPIPEPTTRIIWSLLATLGLSFYRRRRQRV